jgi:hypothetical protein
VLKRASCHSFTVAVRKTGADSEAVTEPRASASGNEKSLFHQPANKFGMKLIS